MALVALCAFAMAEETAEDWVMLGTTKTALVYGMGNKPVVNHE